MRRKKGNKNEAHTRNIWNKYPFCRCSTYIRTELIPPGDIDDYNEYTPYDTHITFVSHASFSFIFLYRFGIWQCDNKTNVAGILMPQRGINDLWITRLVKRMRNENHWTEQTKQIMHTHPGEREKMLCTEWKHQLKWNASGAQTRVCDMSHTAEVDELAMLLWWWWLLLLLGFF